MGIFYNLSKVTKLMSFILKVDRTSTYVSNAKGSVGTMVYLLQAKMKRFIERRWQNGIIFEEVGISQE